IDHLTHIEDPAGRLEDWRTKRPYLRNLALPLAGGLRRIPGEVGVKLLKAQVGKRRFARNSAGLGLLILSSRGRIISSTQ
ncbi:hypothetical protein, partial [Alcaligenes sp. Marseille-Q7550]